MELRKSILSSLAAARWLRQEESISASKVPDICLMILMRRPHQKQRDESREVRITGRTRPGASLAGTGPQLYPHVSIHRLPWQDATRFAIAVEFEDYQEAGRLAHTPCGSVVLRLSSWIHLLWATRINPRLHDFDFCLGSVGIALRFNSAGRLRMLDLVRLLGLGRYPERPERSVSVAQLTVIVSSLDRSSLLQE